MFLIYHNDSSVAKHLLGMCFCFLIGFDSLLSNATRLKPQCIFTMIKKIHTMISACPTQKFKLLLTSFLEFCFLFVNGWSLLSYSSLIFNVKRDTWGFVRFVWKNIKKRIIPEATGEEIMHHALLNFKEWRLIEMHKKLVFYWLNRIKAAVHSQRIIIELVLHCNSFTKSLYQIHLSRLDLLIWL